ncbi:MAG: DUF1822 family protein [Cyanobacteria bacterium J06649_4]
MVSPSSANLDFDFDLEKLYLDLDSVLQEQAWNRSQTLSTAASRWRAYINELAMRSLVSWRASFSDGTEPKSMVRQALWPTVWEWVTGSAWNVGARRWVLMPTEAMDDDELRVPQEWIDIPSWMGDYYLLMQVNPDDGWVKIAGFATHAMLKEKGDFDGRERTYSLSASDLLTDINIIDLSAAIPNVTTQAAVSPVPALPLAQANQLMQRLSNTDQLNPRLAIGFGPWSALIAHSGWRTEMTRQRLGNAPTVSVQQWLQAGLSDWVQQLGWQTMSFQPATAGARGAREENGEDASATARTALSKEITIAEERYRLQVSEILGEQNAWRFELQKINGFIPEGITLRLLTEDLQPFENNEVTSHEPVERLYVDVALASGEGIVWVTEPVSDAYGSEILRF